MKAITVRQPWAWAIVHGGKTIENRALAWSYRGPLAIHAGLRWSERGGADTRVIQAFVADWRRVITAVNAMFAFVRYGDEEHSKATMPANLTLTAEVDRG